MNNLDKIIEENERQLSTEIEIILEKMLNQKEVIVSEYLKKIMGIIKIYKG